MVSKYGAFFLFWGQVFCMSFFFSCLLLLSSCQISLLRTMNVSANNNCCLHLITSIFWIFTDKQCDKRFTGLIILHPDKFLRESRIGSGSSELFFCLSWQAPQERSGIVDSQYLGSNWTWLRCCYIPFSESPMPVMSFQAAPLQWEWMLHCLQPYFLSV